MLCDNCGENEASIRLTQIINGKKTEMMLCEECSKKANLSSMQFEMPIDISNFLGDFISDYEENNYLPFNSISKQIKCNNCNMSYEEFLNSGKFGCSECYEAFSNKVDLLLNKIQGNARYKGRNCINKEENNKKIEINNELDELKKQLRQAIKEERYEDAAKIRDKINEIS